MWADLVCNEENIDHFWQAELIDQKCIIEKEFNASKEVEIYVRDKKFKGLLCP